MLAIFVIALGILFVGGICAYGILMPRYMVKNGRQVDARVLSCEEKEVWDNESGESIKYYIVMVDFYGLNGETIFKEIRCERGYEEGEVIRCRYLDKREVLYPDADKFAKQGQNGGLWVIIGFCVLLFAFLAFVLVIRDENGDVPDWFLMGIGYFISIVFILVGTGGLRSRIKLKGRSRSMQEMAGADLDSKGNDSKVSVIFGLIGVVLLVVMMMTSLGFLDETEAGNNKDRMEQTVSDSRDDADNKEKLLEMFYIYADENAQKCSYNVTIFGDRSGSMTLFPTTTVSGKGIDQYISFEISLSELKKIAGWVETVDLDSLEHHNTTDDPEAVIVTFYIYEGSKSYGGSGLYGEAVYTEGVDVLREVIPDEVWKEMEKREEEYYR